MGPEWGAGDVVRGCCDCTAYRAIARRTRAATEAQRFIARSCSHTRITFHPFLRSIRPTNLSRVALRSSLADHHARRVAGMRQCFGQRCQKQPSTNSATRSRTRQRKSRKPTAHRFTPEHESRPTPSRPRSSRRMCSFALGSLHKTDSAINTRRTERSLQWVRRVHEKSWPNRGCI